MIVVVVVFFKLYINVSRSIYLFVCIYLSKLSSLSNFYCAEFVCLEMVVQAFEITANENWKINKNLFLLTPLS